MADRRWSREEVEALIPRLTRIMEGVIAARAEGARRREALDAEQRRIALAGGGVIDQARWKEETAAIEALVDRVRAGLAEIVELGGVPKDVELGLVDFLHVRDGVEVNLCWRYGESAIAFWHGLDEGYAARKPL